MRCCTGCSVCHLQGHWAATCEAKRAGSACSIQLRAARSAPTGARGHPQHEPSLVRVTDCTLCTLCLFLYDSHVVQWLLPAGAGAAWELTHKSALAAAAHVCFCLPC